MFLLFKSLWNSILEFIGKFIISLVAGVYKIVDYAYQIFLVLGKTNIFEQEHYEALTQKIYVVLGVVMLFIVAYNFLMLVVDPDKNKGGATVEKILKNIVISFVMIVICPSLFTFAFKVSDSILEQGIFVKFFSDSNSNGFSGEKSIKAGGKLMAGTTFAAFFNAADGSDSEISVSKSCVDNYVNASKYGSDISLSEIKDITKATGNFNVYKCFAKPWMVNETAEFNWLFAIVAGLYLAYVIISFCFDLAVRIVKLAFYQIIAPIAIACRILPEKEVIFKNWWKATSQTYISLFIRVFIMNLGVYLITIFSELNIWSSVCANGNCSWGVGVLGNVFIILGIITFIKVASKLLDEIFGFGDVQLGIKDKLKGSGAFALGSGAATGATSMARNATHAWKNVRSAYKGPDGKGKNWGAAIGAGVKGVGSVAAGGVAGTARGTWYAKDTGSFKDMKAQIKSASSQTEENRDKREKYRSAHNITNKAGDPIIKGTTPIIGGIAVAAGHVKDGVKSAGRWIGIDNVDALEKINESIDRATKAIKSIKDTARETLISDAITKGKSNTYGVAATERFNETSEGGVTVNLEYNSKVYREMENLMETARIEGKSTVVFRGQTMDVTDLKGLQGLYAKKFSELMAEQVAIKEESDYKARHSIDIRDELKDIREAYDVSGIRDALKEVIGEQFVNYANIDASAAGKQQITIQSIEHEDLKFTGDNALGKLGLYADEQKRENRNKIDEKKKEEKK